MLFSDKGSTHCITLVEFITTHKARATPKKNSLLAVPERRWATPADDIPPGSPQKRQKALAKNSFDLCSFLGLNAGSLLRIPQAQLLSGIEHLGSLKERKGDRNVGVLGDGRAFEEREWILSKNGPAYSSLWGLKED